MTNRTGISPIIEKDRRHTEWHIKDIYTDEPGSTGRYVPNVDDLVYDYGTGFWRVSAVDYQTGFSTLVPWDFTKLNGGINSSDIVIGGGPGIGSEFYRIYVNTDEVPYVFSIDTRLRIYGSLATYIKIFRENEVTGEAISAQFNSAGVMTSENIQLENVIIPDTNNISIKVPKMGHVTEALENGEVVSVVVYSNSGAVMSIFKLVVVRTNFVRTINASKKLITDISLVSPYLDTNDALMLKYPSNMTLETAGMVGKVTYNDGTVQRYPLNNTNKFQLMGIENYVASEVGQTVPLILSYTLGSDEYSNFVKEVNGERFVTKQYRLTTIEADTLYSVKLFVVPKYNTNNSEWELEYYLTNLAREFIYRVTPYIEYSSNGNRFNGSSSAWSRAQRLTVAINLDRISPNFKFYRHVTEFTITVHQAGSNGMGSSYYTLEYDANNIVGNVTGAIVDSHTDGTVSLNIAGGKNTPAEWLDATYYATDPLTHSVGEFTAPRPSHVKVLIGTNWSREVAVDDILSAITGINVPVNPGDLIRLEFIRNDRNQRLMLGTMGLTAYRV